MPYAINGSEMLVYEYDVNHYIKRGTIPNGEPVTTASLFAPGALITCLEDSKIYRNSGTTAAPVWDSITAISSDEIDQGLIKTVTIALTAAQLKAMFTTPVLVLAGVAGKAHIVDSAMFALTGTATQFTGGGVANVQYDDTAEGLGTAAHADIAASVVTGATALVKTHRIGKDLSAVATAAIDGLGLYFSNKDAVFETGTGTATLTVRYHTV